MRYQITHTTTYSYSEPAALSQNELVLFPRPTPSQTVESSHLSISPRPSFLDLRTDYFGNAVHSFMVQHPHPMLEIRALSRVATCRPVLPAQTPAWETVRDLLAAPQNVPRPPATLSALEFTFPSPFISLSRALADFAVPFFPPRKPLLDAVMDLTRQIHQTFEYTKNATTIDTPPETVLNTRKGVCQDFAHLQIACLRTLGLPARYVSGYLETLPPPGKPKLKGADASHAWLAVYVPDFGWVDFDPTNGVTAGEQHITLAWGRDYTDVTPVKGLVWGGGRHKMQVAVDVARADA